jgi:hypothetical protein
VTFALGDELGPLTDDEVPPDDLIAIDRNGDAALGASQRGAEAAAPAQTATTGTGTCTWHPVDLTDALAGRDVPPPCILTRTDGKKLLYAGRVHSFSGESESLKSWAAQASVASELNLGHDALYIDYEDDARGVVSRLRALGVPDERIARQFVYVRPDEPLAERSGTPTIGSAVLDDLLARSTFSLVVIDGTTEAMTTEGLNLIDNADVAVWQRRLPRRLAATGAAVICIDHVAKNRETQGRYAIGGQHKLAGLTGAAYLFAVLRPLARATTDPVEAVVKITVGKDRPGHVRAHAISEVIAMMAVTSYPNGGVTVQFEPPTNTATEPDPVLRTRILEYLTTNDGISGRGIENAVEGKGQAIREALRWLESEGLISVVPQGKSHLHSLTDTGRAAVADAHRVLAS